MPGGVGCRSKKLLAERARHGANFRCASGTSWSHVLRSPESFIGSPLALVRMAI
jgi:hypothetical protein